MTALKVIPWGDVINAAPGLVKSARKMFTRSQQEEAVTEAAIGNAPHDRVAQLEAAVSRLVEQQKVSAQLIETLAEQNARIVQVVDALRLRTRLLMAASVVLAVSLTVALAWGAWR